MERERENVGASGCWFGIPQGKGKGDRCLSEISGRRWVSEAASLTLL